MRLAQIWELLTRLNPCIPWSLIPACYCLGLYWIQLFFFFADFFTTFLLNFIFLNFCHDLCSALTYAPLMWCLQGWEVQTDGQNKDVYLEANSQGLVFLHTCHYNNRLQHHHHKRLYFTFSVEEHDLLKRKGEQEGGTDFYAAFSVVKCAWKTGHFLSKLRPLCDISRHSKGNHLPGISVNLDARLIARKSAFAGGWPRDNDQVRNIEDSWHN